MSVIQVSTREFREKQSAILDLADNGDNIIIRRGNKTYAITPISDDDLYFTPEILAKIDASIQQANAGKVHRFNDINELDKYLESR